MPVETINPIVENYNKEWSNNNEHISKNNNSNNLTAKVSIGKKHHSEEGERIIIIVYLAQSPGEISPTNIIRSWISLLQATHILGSFESLIIT